MRLATGLLLLSWGRPPSLHDRIFCPVPSSNKMGSQQRLTSCGTKDDTAGDQGQHWGSLALAYALPFSPRRMEETMSKWYTNILRGARLSREYGPILRLCDRCG